jgi:DNA invertase Pin-like site-specific DNA recombinase
MSRVSSDEQAQGYSLGVQEEALTRYCEKNNIRIIQKFREDHSAKDFNRPEYTKFLFYARKHKGQVDFLFVTSWDRFSRNITDAFFMIRTLKNLGITVQAIEQQTDLSIPENKAMLAIFLAIPEIDNDRRSIKIRGGMQAALKSGRWCMKAPRGYRNARDENNRPVIIPGNDVVYIKRMFNGISKGKGQIELRLDLKKEGYAVSKSNFSAILHNPVYMGKVKILANGEEPEHLVEGVHEGIITEDLFYRVQKTLKDQMTARNRPKYSTLRPELFLRGNLKCSICGNKLTGSPSRGKFGTRYFYYHCNHCGKERYRAEKVNETVNSIISDLQFTREANEVYKEMVKMILLGSDNDRNKKLKDLEKEIEK